MRWALAALGLLLLAASACAAVKEPAERAEDNSFMWRGDTIKEPEAVAKRARVAQVLPKWRTLREACSAMEDGDRPSPIYLSIVLATRNKDTSGQHLRLSVFLRFLAEGAADVRKDLELIIVDYNPDPSVPPLHEHPGITWPSLDELPPVRVISVPPEAHQVVNAKYPLHADYWEYEAKNAAVRRACGEYVLVTNPDILLAGPFWSDLVARRRLRPDAYYRMDRCDGSEAMPREALAWPADRILGFLTSRPVDRCWSRDVRAEGLAGDEASAFWARWLAAPVPAALEGRPWAEDRGAAGDFLLASRAAWHRLRGHPELPLQSELDNAMVVQFASAGLRLVSLEAPFVAFHMFHTKAHIKAAKERVLYNDLVAKALDLFGQYDRARWAYGAGEGSPRGALSPANGACWGLCGFDLPCAYL